MHAKQKTNRYEISKDMVRTGKIHKQVVPWVGFAASFLTMAGMTKFMTGYSKISIKCFQSQPKCVCIAACHS